VVCGRLRCVVGPEGPIRPPSPLLDFQAGLKRRELGASQLCAGCLVFALIAQLTWNSHS
jgi:hypothetical protein